MNHTTFRRTTPAMRGAVQLQTATNRHLKNWGVPDYSLVKVDGEYGNLTRLRVSEVAYGLGINHAVDHGVTWDTQQKFLNTKYLTKSEHVLLKGRGPWRNRLVHRLSGGGAAHGVAFALAMAHRGVCEHPAGSNLGPYITQWERLAGYSPPPGVYWCGCFVNACLMAAGMPAQTWGIGYVPSIEGHAKSGANGWEWHGATTAPKAGWIATFTEGGIGGHTEYVVADGFPLNTVGGNTSAGNGSANNGGEVAHHNFNSYHGLPLRGFAAPRYH